MVKLTGPLNSTAASGTLAGTITFHQSRSRTSLRKKAQPKHPRTRLQIACQASLKFLSQEWKTFTDEQRATWAQASNDPKRCPYTNYIAVNFNRLRTQRFPSMTWPPNATTQTWVTVSYWQVCGVRQVEYFIDYTGLWKDAWGNCIYRSNFHPGSYQFPYLVAIIPTKTKEVFSWIDTPLPVDNYSYRSRIFSIDGHFYHGSHITGPCTVKDH